MLRRNTVESEFHTDDVVRTYLNQRRVVEDEVTEQGVVRGDLTESEVRQAETKGSTPIEAAFVDGESLNGGVSSVGVAERETETAGAGRGEDVRGEVTADDEAGTGCGRTG